MSLEPDQIDNVVDGELPIPAINRILPFLRALLPTSSEKASLADVESGVNSLFATSTTSRAIGTGSKTFTVESGRTFLLSLPYVQIADRDDESKWMTGKVTSYSGTSLTVNIDDLGGTGTRSNWIIGVAGRRGV